MESLTGRVPDHWSVASLSEMCDLDVGSTVADRAGRSGPEAVCVVTAKHIVGHTLDTGESPPVVAVPRRLARYRLVPGDVVFARVGRLGRAALVGGEHENWLLGGGCIRIRVRRGLDPRYLLYYLGHPAVVDWLDRSATGSVIPTHSITSLRTLPVVVPPMNEQKAIVGVLGIVDDKIAVHQDIVRATAELRDRLLRLLLTGTSPGAIGPAAAP